MWLDIHGHDVIAERFRRTLARGRLASTYLFVGPSGVGKRAFAGRLAQTLLCQQSAAEFAPCGRCESCVVFAAGNHPDLLQVEKPADKSSLPIELFIGKAEKRNQEGLCHDISLRPMVSRRRVAIIDDADYFNESSANCLLKTLEEPPPQSVIFLIGTALAKQLPTIRSRAQVIRFAPLSPLEMVEVLVERQLVANPSVIQELAQRSGGSVETAVAAQDTEVWQFRDEFLERLTLRPLNGVQLAKELNEFVNGAGKEAPLRRARLRQVIGFAIELCRGLMLSMVSGSAWLEGLDPTLRRAVTRLCEHNVSADTGQQSLQTCLSAADYVLRNANQTTLIQWWSIKLAANLGSGGGKMPVEAI